MSSGVAPRCCTITTRRGSKRSTRVRSSCHPPTPRGATSSSTRCRVIHRGAPGTMSDVYAAADLVAFPSTWEGFGNPPIEASLHRRAAAVGHYPVAAELRAFGFRWFAPDDAVAVRRFLDLPDHELLDRNRSVAVEHF